MIVQNGYIQIKSKQCEGLDPKTGLPKKAQDVTYSDDIPCQYLASSRNNLGYTIQNERYVSVSYRIYIEEQQKAFTAEQIRLKDMDGRVLGEYSIGSIEVLAGVCEVEISV